MPTHANHVDLLHLEWFSAFEIRNLKAARRTVNQGRSGKSGQNCTLFAQNFFDDLGQKLE